MTIIYRVLLFVFLSALTSLALAETQATLSTPLVTPTVPNITPLSPSIDAKGFILIDTGSNKTLAAQNADQRMAPASLTKIMTAYVISDALRKGRIHLNDPVRISEKAWRMGGSKMFVKVGTTPTVQELMQGIIVDSGNDACVAMAEHVAGTEDMFVALMNQQAAALGMTNTHYTDSTGLPHSDHYTTPRDIATLARALVNNYPEDYKWYSQKWFAYNNIKQPNRNRLLWRDPSVDGIKTGHTDEAGFCLVASALRNGTRLISAVMGAPSDASRAESSQNLLNFGFRFFETHKLYAANTKLTSARVWFGSEKQIPVGIARDLFVTTSPGMYPQIKASVELLAQIKAPIAQGQTLGSVNVTLNGEKIATAPLIALRADPKAGIWTRMNDSIALTIHHFFNKGSA